MARPGLTGHRKFRRLVRALDVVFPGLGIGRAIARGYLELLWDSCYESGEEYVGTADDIEALVGWTGESGMLTRALVEAGAPEGLGFLEPVDGTEGGFRVHDLWHHAPEYVANRRAREDERRKEKVCEQCGVVFFAADPRSRYCSSACRQGGWRDRHVTERNVSLNFTSVTETDRNGSPAPTPTPAHEEKNGSALRTPDAFLVYPTNGPVSEWTLSKAQVAEWAELYPGTDVEGECRKALAWLRANKGRRKTAKGMPRCLVNWLGRANDRGSGGARTASRQDISAVSHEWICPHEPQCLGRHACYIKQRIAAAKAGAA